MAYLNAYLDACAAYGWTGGPEFKTRIRVLANGRERRNADWAQGRHRYTLPFLNIGAEAYRSVRQMHEVCRGMLHAFRYRDPLDYRADNATFGIGTGTLQTYQLSKLSQIDGVNYQRAVYALPAIPLITSNGSPVVPSAVDLDRGTITITATNGHVLRWTGDFDVWVRFNQDWLPFSIDNRRGADDYARNGQVDLMEVAPPEPEAES